QAALATAGEGFNVRAYGARGDGTTDDTAAIQATITAAAAAGGGVVFIPAGTYLVCTTPSNGNIFTISQNNLILRGEGKKVSIIKSCGAMGTGHKMFVISGTHDDLENLGFQGTNATDSSTAVYFGGSVDSSIRRSWIDLQYGWSIQVYAGALRT